MPVKVPWMKGVFPALVTPFDKEENVDEAAFRHLIRHVLPHVDGLVPCGTTGEFPYLTREEQKRLVEIAVEEASGKPVIAGAGAPSTRQAIELARDAKEAGATACLIVTPYFLHPSDKGVYQHFYEIARAVDIPILLYNIPQVMDAYLPRRVVEDLADIPNIVGLKDSSGDLPYMMEVLEFCGDRIDVFVGHDEVVLNALSGGASGMILASAQVYPEVWQQVFAAVQAGDLPRARQLQRSVQKLSRIFCRYGGGVAVKQALKMMGVDTGRPRRPLKSVGGALLHEDRAEIELELEKLGKVQNSYPDFQVPTGPLEERFGDLELSPEIIRQAELRLGTGAAGEEPECVQLDLIAGPKDSPLGEAYAYQLTYPLHRREALTTILEPNLTVRPPTLILPTLEQKNLRQANMIYGPTQSAVARAIVDALEAGVIPASAMDTQVMIVLASVHPRALDRHTLYHNVRQAMSEAIRQAFGSEG
ncbi:MAG: 4-hydroxy-tetrahydrodipicolinate synthase [Anaerolineae bacterium]|jgi:4-hydroxy-tetrahydrodipicolinate synthase|nr:4-hydroxy-tetrahydrodipicolinate synthase [Anaerolineae bacterium]MDH7472497.1 4-hydroxy-tetrahydrodipicolinate synthase [Anaerolineae bacterium]